MRTSSPLFLLGALGTLGVLSATPPALAAPVDTSAWKCSSCPFEKGASGAVDVGLGSVSKQAGHYSDFTGLDKGAYLLAGGNANYRNESGFFGSVWATDLGLDSRALAAELGQDALVVVNLS